MIIWVYLITALAALDEKGEANQDRLLVKQNDPLRTRGGRGGGGVGESRLFPCRLMVALVL